VVLTRIGRHRYTRRQRLVTLAVVAVLVGKYVRNMPTTGHDGVLEAVCAGIGALFGLAMLAVTSVDRDENDGQIWVKAGIANLARWVILLGARVAFAYSATGWARGDIRITFGARDLYFASATPWHRCPCHHVTSGRILRRRCSSSDPVHCWRIMPPYGAIASRSATMTKSSKTLFMSKTNPDAAASPSGASIDAT
jgi:hypothetical protein